MFVGTRYLVMCYQSIFPLALCKRFVCVVHKAKNFHYLTYCIVVFTFVNLFLEHKCFIFLLTPRHTI